MNTKRYLVDTCTTQAVSTVHYLKYFGTQGKHEGRNEQTYYLNILVDAQTPETTKQHILY